MSRTAARQGLFAGDEERRSATALAELVWCNPFLPRRVELERDALGDRFVPVGTVWHVGPPGVHASPNVPRLAERAEELAAAAHGRLAAGARPTSAEAAVYRDLVTYLLWARCEHDLFDLLPDAAGSAPRTTFAGWTALAGELERLLAPLGARAGDPPDAAHLAACFFQVRRAFHNIHRYLLGGSVEAARLRAETWHSLFGHDLRRYHRSLWRQMADIPTLVTGPSGTGKELVARALALSRYAPFRPADRTFALDLGASFYPLHLAALSPTLVESELFGHRRGAFTGAVEDRSGWLEVCPAGGTVFLDEIGEVDGALQVKLLRVLETRSFQRVGESRPRRFAGKLVAATNRDLGVEMRAGRFRPDLYYRLCGDIIRTPSLAERLQGAPAELPLLLSHLAEQMVGPEEAAAVAAEAQRWITTRLPPGYAWPGNVRELGQCLRNVLLRREYHPGSDGAASAEEALLAALGAGRLTLDELARRYATLVYARCGSYLETGRRLGIDRRTVRAYVDEAMLAELRAGSARESPEPGTDAAGGALPVGARDRGR